MRPLALIALGAVAVPGAASAPSKPAGRIVFASARSSVGQAAGEQIYSLDVGSGRIRNLSRSGESDAAPAPSHRKNLIAFVRISRSTGKGAQWVMRSDGSGQHPVADLQVFLHEQDQEIAWSTDGSMIAFSSFEPPDGARLWVVKPDGSGLRRLTDVFAASPSWSPDGAEVAFSGGVSADSEGESAG